MLKLSENPPVTFPEDKSVRDFEGTWWVAHTKARNEKALAWDLMGKGISYFLPLVSKASKTPKGRVIRSLVPLFSSYMFFCGDENARVETLRTHRVANIIPCTSVEHFINELWAIEKAIESGADLKPYNFIEVGQKCRVIAGPLMGTEGIVVRTSKETRLILQIDMLGQATSVDIEADLLELI